MVGLVCPQFRGDIELWPVYTINLTLNVPIKELSRIFQLSIYNIDILLHVVIQQNVPAISFRCPTHLYVDGLADDIHIIAGNVADIIPMVDDFLQ